MPREPGVPGIGVLVAGFAVGLAATIAVARAVVSHDSDAEAAEAALASIALWLGLLGACVFVSRRRGSGSLRRDAAFHFRWIDIPLGLGTSLAGRLLAGAAAAPIPLPTTRLRDLDDPSLTDPLGGWGWLLLVAVVCIGAPVVEEVFFRGFLQTRLVGRFGTAVGIGLGSLLFGAAHLIGWDGPLSLANAWAIAGGGLTLGAARHYSGRLGPAVMGHVFFNVQAVLAIALLR